MNNWQWKIADGTGTETGRELQEAPTKKKKIGGE